MRQLTNSLVDWRRADTLLLDMDGTLLDLSFDTYFWLTVLPAAYAASVGKSLDEVADYLGGLFTRHRGTLNWYAVDFWSAELSLDVMALQRQHAERIGYLDGAPEFLAAARAAGKRCVMVTNADRNTLQLKDQRTGVTESFDDVVSSHDFGMPKEQPGFWRAFCDQYDVVPDNALFIDDTATVLQSAVDFGIGQVLAIAQPDSKAAVREIQGFAAVRGVVELITA
ncbi:MAG: HAD-IA family hydrolase [Gammaproteobacteria bacterium]